MSGFRPGLLVVLLAGCQLSASSPTLPQEPPKPAPGLEAKVLSVLPSAAEDRWLRIPWRTNLVAARQEAQRLGKPILFWVMNGNPLGCA